MHTQHSEVNLLRGNQKARADNASAWIKPVQVSRDTYDALFEAAEPASFPWGLSWKDDLARKNEPARSSHSVKHPVKQAKLANYTRAVDDQYSH